MPKRTNRFQHLVYLINRSLSRKAQVTESVMVTDLQTGDQREIDVEILEKVADSEVRTAVEATAVKNRADVCWIEQMHGKHSALPTDKLVLVSKQGFTKSALKKAECWGIETVGIATVSINDWKIAAELTSCGVFELTTFQYSCYVVYEFTDGVREQIKEPTSLSITNGHARTTLDEFVRKVLNRADIMEILRVQIIEKMQKQFWFSYRQDGSLWKTIKNGQLATAMELRVDIAVGQSLTPVEYSSGKYQNNPFIEGVSTVSADNLQFVLVKKPDGMVTGTLDTNVKRR